MTIERLICLLETYGGHPRRWPETDRAAAESLILESPQAQELLTKARALDNLLDALPPLPATDNVRRRILTQVDSVSGPGTRQSAIADWFLGHWWPQVAALTAAAILGIFIGARVLPPADRPAEIEVAEWVFASDMTEGVDR